MARPSKDIMRARAFTLWELVVAIGLLLIIAALAVPLSLAWFGQAQFDEAGRQVEAALSMARSDAQREGKPVQIMLRPDESGGWSVVKVPVLGAPDFEGDATAQSRTSSDRRADETLVSLPRNVQVSLAPKNDDDAAGTPNEPANESGAASSDDDSAHEGFVVATFMPDGEPTRCSAWVMADTKGKALRFTIDSWTGQVKVSSVTVALVP